jgi:serine/threonine protein kinase
MLVREKRTGSHYAMKVVRKDSLVNQERVMWLLSSKFSAFNERHLLVQATKASSPFIIQLHSAFQTESLLFLATEMMVGGDLESQMYANGPLTAKGLKLNACEIFLAVKCCHDHHYIYRYVLLI